MMKKCCFATCLLLILAACSGPDKGHGTGEGPVNLILETDLGNDIDDAIALDMIYKYLDLDKVNLLAICLNKEGTAPAEYTDIMNTWYGYPDIPIGIIRDGIDCENDAVNYAKAVTCLTEPDGTPTYPRSLRSYDSLPEAHILYRKILAEQEDNSVVIASVGFSTNLVRLLDTKPDQYSELNGEELVRKKVKLLVPMAGCFNNPEIHEYNVAKDVASARRILEDWPSPVVVTPFELGVQVCYPASSIENDLAWAPNHPLADAYRSYMEMPYDRPTWDPSAVLYAVEGDRWFSVSPYGHISVDDEGSTIFTENPEGTRRYLYINQDQAEAMKNHYIELVSLKPEKRK